MTDVTVERDDADLRYLARVDDREVGSAYFQNSPSGQVIFTHTEVSDEVAGQGVGSSLVQQALDDVRSRGLTVEPRCPFVARFIAEHPDYEDLVLRQ